LVNQGASTGGAFTTSTNIPVATADTATGTDTANGPNVLIGTSGTTATLVYEIYYANQSVQETLNVPISVEYVSTTTTPVGGTSTVAVSFSPQSSTHTASSTAPIPRFGISGAALNLFSITPCTCNLLFPFVANVVGFNTGIAIANTSSDPFGTTPQTGTVTLWYYGGSAPPPKATSTAIAAGQELIFDLLDGNTAQGVPATPGFEGYIIATANFQYCHGFAFLSHLDGSNPEGYLAIQLDAPGLTRTGNTGENKGQ
jgi:hypothetical protein